MSEFDPINNDARRTTRAQKLGADAVCVRCGEPQWETLIPGNRSLLEAHHLVGKANDADLTVPLCRNCHAILTEKLRQVGASMNNPLTLLDRIVAILRCIGAFLGSIGNKFLQWADQLTRFMAALDRNVAHWRTMPEAV
jgi:hypothetical protein